MATGACPFHQVLDETLGLSAGAPPARLDVPLMPLGQAFDMGRADDGTPLVDPRIFDTAEFQRNPYPYYRILRDHHPVFHDPLHNCYWVTRYDDVTAGYHDDEGFNTIPKGMSNGVLGNTQLELSGIEHRRRRNLYGRHLVGQALDKRIPIIERLAEEMIATWFDGTAADGSVVVDDARPDRRSVELGKAFANEFPIRVVCQVLGFPDEARSQFFYWYSSMMNGLGGSETAHIGIRARQDLEDYVADLVEARRREPTYLLDDRGEPIGKDIISELCTTVLDGDLLSAEEITSNIALIVGGGGETTRGAILNMWYLLLQHPDQFAAVCADESLWDAAFHETLRHSSSIGGQPRHTSYDITLHGTTIPAGSLVNMVDFSANHDERIFADPERFDLFRPDLYTGKIIRSGYDRDGRRNHMAFGVGPHLCPGAWISHQEAVLGSKVLARELARHGLSVSIDASRMPKDIDGVSLAPIGLGAIRSLWLALEPTA
jgi:pulcherriminic acid synthase